MKEGNSATQHGDLANLGGCIFLEPGIDQVA